MNNKMIAKELVKIAKSLVAKKEFFEDKDDFYEYMKDPSHKARAIIPDYEDNKCLFTILGGSLKVISDQEGDTFTIDLDHEISLEDFIELAGYDYLDEMISDRVILPE